MRRSDIAKRGALIVQARAATGAAYRQPGEAFDLHWTTIGDILRRAGLQAGRAGLGARTYTDSPAWPAPFRTKLAFLS